MNKSKLFSSIIIALLSLACLCVGVYAAIKASQNVSASVNFNPNGVFVEMSGQIYRGERRDTLYPVYEDATYTLKTCRNFRVLDETEDESKEPFYSINTPSWTFNPVKFFPQQRWIQVKLTFKNLGKQNISVIPTADMPTSITTNVDVYEEASDALLIEPGETREYRLNLKLKDSVTTTIDNTTFTMPLDIRNTSDIENPASDFTMNTSTKTQLDSINSSYSNPIYAQRVVVVPTSLGAKSTSSNYPFGNLTASTKYLIFPEGLETLAAYSLDSKTGLVGVSIPSSVTSIGNSAFQGCSSLASITIPSSVTSIDADTFYGCTTLASITIPSSVTSIDAYTFYGCTTLASITISSSVTSISGSSFYDCSSLMITVDEANTNYSSLGGSLYDKNKATLIRGAGKATIDDIPSSVTSIGGYAFRGCTSLASITIPSSVTSIQANAFFRCTSLASITIPNSVTSIGNSAFDYCSSLMITVDEANANYSSSGGSLYDKNKVTLIKGAGKVVVNDIPSSVTSIGKRAFKGCTLLTSITIPSSVTFIDSSAFSYCSSLTSITIPSSVTSIQDNAFFRCTSLASITIPGSVTSIDSYAFSYCASLTSITIPSKVSSIGRSAFEYCSSLTTVNMEGAAPEIYANSFGYSSSAPYTNSSFKIRVIYSGYQPTSGYSTSGSSKANWYYYNSNGKIRQITPEKE